MSKSKIGKANRNSDECDEGVLQIDVQYNPDIVAGLIQDLGDQVDMRCAQIQTDTDFIIMQLQQQFQIELIKLPTQIKKMTMAKFREQYGDSLELIPKSNYGEGKFKQPLSYVPSSQNSNNNSNNQNYNNSNHVLETPFAKPNNLKANHLGMPVQAVPQTASRAPREGEVILSSNGSPLGGFTTIQKPSRPLGATIVPQTPGVFVPLKSGDIIDIDTLSSADIDKLDKGTKDDALLQMQAMVENMQRLMGKLQ